MKCFAAAVPRCLTTTATDNNVTLAIEYNMYDDYSRGTHSNMNKNDLASSQNKFVRPALEVKIAGKIDGF